MRFNLPYSEEWTPQPLACRGWSVSSKGNDVGGLIGGAEGK